MKTYVIHATCRYVVKNKRTGQTENGQNRPTIAIEASSEAAALRKATKQHRERVGTPHWPVVGFALVPELVNVIEHPTPAQRKALTRFLPSGGGSSRRPVDRGMLRRLVEKGWLVGSTQDGYVLTPAGRREVG